MYLTHCLCTFYADFLKFSHHIKINPRIVGAAVCIVYLCLVRCRTMSLLLFHIKFKIRKDPLTAFVLLSSINMSGHFNNIYYHAAQRQLSNIAHWRQTNKLIQKHDYINVYDLTSRLYTVIEGKTKKQFTFTDLRIVLLKIITVKVFACREM